MSNATKSLMLLFFLATLNSCQTKNPSGDGTNGNFFNFISDPKDDLVGDFSLVDTGKAQIRVTKQSGNYFVSSANGDGASNAWSDPEQLANFRDTDFVQIFGANWKEFVDAGLTAGQIGICKVKKGYKFNEITFKTGYFLVALGGTDLYKL